MEQDTIYELLPQDCREHLRNKMDGSAVTIPFIRNDNNEVVCERVSDISHMLIAGTTGTGKTVFVQSLLTFISVGYNSQKAQFIIIDSKGIEYISFNGVPHLLIPVVTDMKKASAVFSWIEHEIEDRLSKQHWETNLFIVVDDYATLSMNGYYNEGQLIKILQLGRSAGVHFWLVTSIPTAKIISTELKMNIPYRIAFNVTSKGISRMILDDMGAESLYVPDGVKYKGLNKTVSGKIIYIEDEVIDAVLGGIKKHSFIAEPSLDIFLVGNNGSYPADSFLESNRDMYFYEAGRLVIEKDKASIGMLQRAFKIGFNRAARIMDQLAELGVVGEEEGTKPRKILMNLYEFEQLNTELEDVRQKKRIESSKEAVQEVDRNINGYVWNANRGREIGSQLKAIGANRNEENHSAGTAQAVQRKEQNVWDDVRQGATAAFQNGVEERQTGLGKLKDVAIKVFSQNVTEESQEKEVSFTPRLLIQGKDAGLEICDDHIEISKRLNAVQTATYSFVPRRIKRVIYHAPTLLSEGYVRFELDSFEWNIIDERTKKERPQKLPEQVFTVKFNRGMKKAFENYARQIAAEAALEYVEM